MDDLEPRSARPYYAHLSTTLSHRASRLGRCWERNMGKPTFYTYHPATKARSDCGYPNITRAACQQKGCSWDESDEDDEGQPWCFYKFISLEEHSFSL